MGACCYCQGRAGFLKKTCPDCRRMEEVFKALESVGSFGFKELIDVLLNTGASPEKVDLFLETDLGEKGSIRNRVTARMTNEVMGSLGIPSAMKPEDVQKVRESMTPEKKKYG